MPKSAQERWRGKRHLWPYSPMFFAYDCDSPRWCPSLMKMRTDSASLSQSPLANPCARASHRAFPTRTHNGCMDRSWRLQLLHHAARMMAAE
jgi:hypothetical protein